MKVSTSMLLYLGPFKYTLLVYFILPFCVTKSNGGKVGARVAT